MARILTIATAAGRLRLRVADAGAALAAGAVTPATIAGRTVRCQVGVAGATGGTAPYNYQLQYALDDGAGSPGPWVDFPETATTLAAGAAPGTYSLGGLGPGQTYHWRSAVTDSAASPATAYGSPATLTQPASDLTGIGAWWDAMTTTLTGGRFNPTLSATIGPTIDNFAVNSQGNHDGIYCAAQGLRARPGDPDLTEYLTNQRRLFRDHYVLNTMPPGAVQAYLNLSEGVALDWEWNGDAASRNALDMLRQNAAFAGPVPAAWIADEEASRETAYALNVHVEADRLGVRAWNATYVALLLNTALGHIDQWCGDPAVWQGGTGTYDYIQAFMMGLTGNALARYLDYIEAAKSTTDARIVPALARVAVRLRERWWVAAQGAWRLWRMPDGLADVAADYNSSVTNTEIASIHAWLYRRTGDPYFRTAADEAFNGLVPTTGFYTPKEYNEGYRYSFRLLDWRETPPDSDNAYLVVDPPDPPVGVAGTGTLTFKLKPTQVVSQTVTLSDGGAGGSFSPSASVSWSAARDVRTVTYTLPSTPGTHTVSVSGYAPLSAPVTSVAVRALDPATLATTVALSGPTTGLVGVPATFTLTPDGPWIGHLCPDDGADWANGFFALPPTPGTEIIVMGWAGTSEARTFTFTPYTTGVSTINLTDHTSWPAARVVPTGLTYPTPITFTAS